MKNTLGIFVMGVWLCWLGLVYQTLTGQWVFEYPEFYEGENLEQT